MSTGYETLDLEKHDGVAWVTFHNGQLNLLDRRMLGELDHAGRALEGDPDVNVVVLQTANPDFFLAHVDVQLLDVVRKATERQTELPLFHSILERFRTMPKITIAKVRGRARGAGSEVLLAVDMRFAAESAVLAQPEMRFGFPPGGGALVRLARLVGRGRALEVVLSGRDFSTAAAERMGWVNRALPDDALDGFVASLATRLARNSPDAIRILKRTFNAVEDVSTVEGLLEEWHAFGEALRTPEAIRRVRRFQELGGQTVEGERGFDALLDRVSSGPQG